MPLPVVFQKGQTYAMLAVQRSRVLFQGMSSIVVERGTQGFLLHGVEESSQVEE
jgi:hypothetical protein